MEHVFIAGLQIALFAPNGKPLLLATSVILDMFSTQLPTPAFVQSKTARYVSRSVVNFATRTIYLQWTTQLAYFVRTCPTA